MPISNAPSSVDLSDAPAPLTEESLDGLFPNPETDSSATPAPTTAKTATETQAPPPQAPPINEFVIQGKKSRYRNTEEATRGIDEKDDLIEKMRQRYILATGLDPVTGQSTYSTPQVSDSYMSNPEKYVQDLFEASKVSDPKLAATRYRDTQLKLVMDSLAPLAPVLSTAAKRQAIEALRAEIPDAEQVLTSPAYSQALEQMPDLREAIEAAEGNYQFHARLPGLLRVAYFTTRGVQLPELLNAARPTSPTPVRPTTSPVTPSIPQVVETKPADLSTSEGRKALIEAAKRSGIADSPWTGWEGKS